MNGQRWTATTSQPQILSLFCGAGGLDLGFRRGGFSIPLAYDLDPVATETVEKNLTGTSAVQADLTRVGADRIALDWDHVSDRGPFGVIGGPPCQAFSIANRSKDFADPRARLVTRYGNLVSGLTRKFPISFFVFENVIGLLDDENRERHLSLKAVLERAGFALFEAKLNAADFGVPQFRKRYFLVGIHRSRVDRVSFTFPEAATGTPRTVRQALSHLPAPAYFSNVRRGQAIPYHPNHWCMTPRSKKFSSGTIRQGSSETRSFRALSWDRPSWTVAYGNREVHVHPNRRRRLSVLEAMILQGFPERYELLGSLSDQIRMISNAVPPPLAQALANQIKRSVLLKKTNGSRSHSR